MKPPLSELFRTADQTIAQRRWDVVVVGAGHNGLTAAAYLARSGRSVLVVEQRDRIGGAATLEEMWPGYIISPCAYLAGLFHDRVIDELDLRSRGLEIVMGDPTYFVPFPDGAALTVWNDDARTHDSIRAFAPDQVDGWVARNALFDRIRDALRPADDTDLWLDLQPTRAEVERRLGGDEVALATMFTDSQVDNLRRFFTDERMVAAYCGQGIIGTNASVLDPGTAFVDFHHASGRQEGIAGEWGFVMGGMGAVSVVLAKAAEEAGAVIATEVEVVRIVPGSGVVLANGDLVEATVVVANADPVRTASMIGDPGFAARVARTPIESATVKVTFALSELPDFGAAHATRAQVEIVTSADAMHQSYLAARAGTITDEIWCELYFQTPYDPSIAPEGKHVLSAFCQYGPYAWADGGSWDEHRREVGQVVTRSIERYAPGFGDLVEAVHVQGPPDIESSIGLTGGHIFHGEILPQYMWENRLGYRTGLGGVYLCGAGTHPGGSVIGINGRNAAMAVLEDSTT
ncbi:MAG TPA: NAD(P)/FAD-dependent oxidoreductase [Acidimicrobiia bacterium]|nr:NAD(P)/FAD-dependent oxidoreductase [Acidimicrobiia bacterium]